MTSVLSSLFTSASAKLTARIETMRQAEGALINFSKRFGADTGTEESHSFQLFDTKIPRKVVPLKGKRNEHPTCQLNVCSQEEESKGDHDSLIMHGIEVTSNGYEKPVDGSNESPLVLLHGYANGALYFYRNLLGLSENHFGGKVFALDLLGWGLSSRPKFEIWKKGDDEIKTAEEFFVESLEAWRKAHKLEKMTLGGHSMGGYLSVAYCEKYPQHVDRLILMSPAGVPPGPSTEELNEQRKDLPLRFRFMIGLATYLWTSGHTPSSFVRSLPEKNGRKMVSGYIKNRLPSITCAEEQKALTDYLYTNAALPGSGEYCLNKILKPMAYAKRPLLHRIPSLQVSDISFIYGQTDWMDPSAGLEVQRICNEESDTGMKKNTPKVEVFGVRNAGHLLMLENFAEFNSAVIMAGGGGHKLPAHYPKPLQFVGATLGSRTFFSKPNFRKKDEPTEDGPPVLET